MSVFFKIFTSLMIFWLLLTVSLRFDNLLYGMIFSGIIALFSYRIQIENKVLLPRIRVLVRFGLFLVIEILLSSVKHIVRILKNHEERIVFIHVDVESLSEFEAVMAANFITLTPGTVTVNLSDHWITVVTMLSDGEDASTVKADMEKIFDRIFRKGEAA